MRSYQKTICALAAAAMLAPLPALAEEGGLILPGFSTGAAVQSYLRLFNSDGAPHSPVVMLHSAATGEMLGAWTGPSIPTGGTYEASLAAMIAGSDPPITPERLPRSLVLRVSGPERPCAARRARGRQRRLEQCHHLRHGDDGGPVVAALCQRPGAARPHRFCAHHQRHQPAAFVARILQ